MPTDRQHKSTTSIGGDTPAIREALAPLNTEYECRRDHVTRRMIAQENLHVIACRSCRAGSAPQKNAQSATPTSPYIPPQQIVKPSVNTHHCTQPALKFLA
jgi:hypothetical protein